MNRSSRLLLMIATSCALCALLPESSGAQPSHPYTFLPIADTSGPWASMGVAAINNRGVVAFNPRLDSGGPVVLTWYRSQLTLIATGGTHEFLQNPDVNDRGEVSFERQPPAGSGSFLKVRHSRIVEQVDASGPFQLLVCCPLLNNRGAMTAFALLDDGTEGIFRIDRGRITTIADSHGPFTHFGPPVGINERGQVAFTADPDDPERAAVVLGDGRSLTVVADASGPFEFFTSPMVNNRGDVAFQAFPDGGEPTPFLLVADHRGVRIFVDASGPFEFPDRPLLNDAGLLVFTATLDGGGSGVFTGADPVADKVLASGDPLAGSVVVGARAMDVNDAGEIVVFAELADGRRGLWLADPHGK